MGDSKKTPGPRPKTPYPIVSYRLPFHLVEILKYGTKEGICLFADWLDALDAQAAAKIVVALGRMEFGNFGDSKSVGEGVIEQKLTYGPGYRIYYDKDGDPLVILLVGGTNKRQSADIKQAKAHWQNYKKRKGQ